MGRKGKLVKEILKIFSSNPLKTFNYKQVSARLDKQDMAGRDLVSTILIELFDDQIILEVKPGKYKMNPEHLADIAPPPVTISGKVDMKQTGKAYVTPEEGGEDIFIASNNTGHALHGDKVSVRLFPKRPGRKLEGQITGILQRNKEQFVGVVNLYKNFAFLIPDSQNMPVDIFIPREMLLGAKNGQKAIAKITDWPEHSKNPFGEIVDVLGFPGDNNVEMQSILAEYDFPLSFPADVEKDADRIPVEIPGREIARRRDFRNVFTLTIDPEDAKDYDDAISLLKLENGNWEVGVHIADVSHYVGKETSIDKEAFRRGTSIYLVDRVIPMLPEKLSNNVCSLQPQTDKLCFSAVFEMNDEAEIIGQW